MHLSYVISFLDLFKESARPRTILLSYVPLFSPLKSKTISFFVALLFMTMNGRYMSIFEPAQKLESADTKCNNPMHYKS